VPFFSISGSDFVEMFVGVGASRVRDLFKQARENSPCIIFLDEIDAVGRRRGSGMGGGHDEREQTLNAILSRWTASAPTRASSSSPPRTVRTCSTRRSCARAASTARSRSTCPTWKGRRAILTVHLKRVKSGPTPTSARWRAPTPGYSGADLAPIINEGRDHGRARQARRR
jgi:cell division protease FtsH